MIRLRGLLERGCAHPLLGPILLVALVLVLAMAFLHLASSPHGIAGFGVLCFALVTVLGAFALDRLRSLASRSWVSVLAGRGPPAMRSVGVLPAAACPAGTRSLPLRR